MAIDIKALLADAMLEMSRSHAVDSITLKALLEKTGVSKQTFYNHFMDKNDLIEWIYKNRVLNSFLEISVNKSYYESTLDYYKRIEKYHYFMKSACSITGQNCLTSFMVDYSINYDILWHQAHYNMGELPPAMRFASEYHSLATINTAIRWILNDMPIKPETIAKRLTKIRKIGLEEYFYGEDSTAYGTEELEES